MDRLRATVHATTSTCSPPRLFVGPPGLSPGPTNGGLVPLVQPQALISALNPRLRRCSASLPHPGHGCAGLSRGVCCTRSWIHGGVARFAGWCRQRCSIRHDCAPEQIVKIGEFAAMKVHDSRHPLVTDIGLYILLAAVSILGLVPHVLAQPNKDDIACLHGFQASVQASDPSLFNNWTDLAFPCNVSGDGQRASYVGVTCSSSRVVSLVLSNKGLTGTISPNLSLCRNLGTLDLSSNSLTGPLPAGLGQLSYLMTLNVSYNQINGPIPAEITNCSYLHELDLENNHFSGELPPALATLQKLQIFDVSNNDLDGPIPTGLSNTSSGAPRFNISSFQGNDGLYGYPLPYPKSHSLSILAIVGIGLGSGFLSLIVSFTAVCIWLRVTEQRLAAEEGKISQLVPEYD